MGGVAVTVDGFKELYPAFAVAGDTWIQALIDQIETQVSDLLTGDDRDEIVGLEVAARLARSPIGRKASLLSKDGTSTFSRELDQRRQQHACLLLRVY